MPARPKQVVVRHHDRFPCGFVGRLSVDAAHLEQVCLSKSASDGEGHVELKAVDCSGGGIGLHVPVYVPRTCRLELMILVPTTDGHTEPFTLRARVQRVSMISRKPMYYIGAAFVAEDSGAARIDRLVEAARTPPVQAKGGAAA